VVRQHMLIWSASTDQELFRAAPAENGHLKPVSEAHQAVPDRLMLQTVRPRELRCFATAIKH